MKRRCPVCNKPLEGSSRKEATQAEFFPFCSERCKLLDLGHWLDAEYKIADRCGSQELEEDSQASSEDFGQKQ